ncbi:MAG: SRPBCC domain-containing protein [Ignavibacteriae bacterium]|nr:SRPBCC domain-containing protein [Ignavibacteriota bacterium]MCB9208549.1 SRPBCC domain-containing protein [Ignavibacteriales bacterium]MCB9258342.1 SRPBCC domain-containing protein [Ignavibacteriales bacterium]
MEILNTTPDREITVQRILNFPIELVYKAFEEPNHLKNWWGPKGFTNTFHTFEFMPGGKWIFTMHGPDKGNYKNECNFIIVEKNKLLVWDHYVNPKFYVIVQFKEIAKSKTELTFKQLFDSVELRDKIKKYTKGKNEENFDRLENELSKMKGK